MAAKAPASPSVKPPAASAASPSYERQPAASGGGDWKRLQRKVFSRWINMKFRLGRSSVTIKEDDLAVIWGRSGFELVSLIECLSKKKFSGKAIKLPEEGKALSRIVLMEQVKRALDFGWASGVQAQGGLAVSPENLVDAGMQTQATIKDLDYNLSMGYVWIIMRSFLKFGDDDDRLSAEKALLMWVKNQTKDYAEVKVNGFGKDWHNGYAFCALIHKYRPDLIGDWPPSGSNEENIKKAMDAAESWLNMEQYLLPGEIAILDDKSMIIYVSEYYYGITGQAKLFQAKKRITDLIDYTRGNDGLRDQYIQKARKLRNDLDDSTRDLNLPCDDTMAGAKDNIKKFQNFKDTKKASLNTDYLQCESILNQLSTNLAAALRPQYVPEAGCALQELRSGLDGVEAQFQEMQNKLYKELERQKRLANLNDQHLKRYNELLKWIGIKTAYLAEDFTTATSSARSKQLLGTLQSFQQESSAQQKSLVDWQAIGKELVAQRFEFAEKVTARETDIDQQFVGINAKAAENDAALNDQVARLLVKEAVEADLQTHAARCVGPDAFVKGLALRQAPSVVTAEDAQAALDFADVILYECQDMSSSIKGLGSLSAKIAKASYKSALSSYKYDGGEALVESDANRSAEFQTQQQKLVEFQDKSRDDLARLTFKEDLLQDAALFQSRASSLTEYIEGELAFDLKTDSDSVESANAAFSAFKLRAEKQAEKKGANKNITALGKRICEAKFESSRSSYSYDNPEAIQKATDNLQTSWAALDAKNQQTKAELADNLARLTFIEKILEDVSHLVQSFDRLKSSLQKALSDVEAPAWVADATSLPNYTPKSAAEAASVKLLQVRRVANTVGALTTEVNQVDAESKRIASASYSGLTSYVYDKSDELSAGAAEVCALLAQLEAAAPVSRAALEDMVQREHFKGNVHADEAQHAARFQFINSGLQNQLATVAKPDTSSVSKASVASASFKLVVAEIAEQQLQVNALTELGAVILAANYQGATTYTYEKPDEINQRHDIVIAALQQLSSRAAEIAKEIADDLAQQKEMANMASLTRQHVQRSKSLEDWMSEQSANVSSLGKEEEVNSVEKAIQQLRSIENSAVDYSDHKDNLDAVKALGQQINDADQQAREQALEVAYGLLGALISDQKSCLEGLLQKQQAREAACVAYASAASDFTAWANAAIADAKVIDFAETSMEDLKTQNNEGQIATTRETLAAKYAAQAEIAVNDGLLANYTQLTQEDCNTAQRELSAALDAREAELQSAMAAKKDQDSLCKAYADLAIPFTREMDEKRDAFTKSVASMQEQLQAIEAAIESLPLLKTRLANVQSTGAVLKEQGIVNNPYCMTDSDEVALIMQNYEEFLNAKAQNLRGQIEAQKNLGIPPATLAEFEANFKQFDSNGSGELNAEEFKQCLYSLGENKSKEEIASLLTTYGNGTNVEFGGFLAFMKKLHGNNNSKEALMESVSVIGPGGGPPSRLEQCKTLFSAEQLAYLQENVPKKANGDIDFPAWVEQSYMR